jgi:hypothetical protein
MFVFIVKPILNPYKYGVLHPCKIYLKGKSNICSKIILRWDETKEEKREDRESKDSRYS